jgi:prolyl-tRNA synthetase
LCTALGGGLMELASPEDIFKVTGAPLGFAGPKDLKNVRIIADESVKYMKNATSGANRKDLHIRNINAPRDFKPEKFVDIRTVKEGDPCPRCKAP